MSTIQTISAPLTIKAASSDGTGTKLANIDVLLYTGGPMSLEGFDHPLIIDLAGMTRATNVPMLREHDPDRVIGHALDIQITASEIHVRGVLSGANEDTIEIRDSATNGLPWQASMGARTIDQEFVPAGKAVEVNGRTFVGPLIVARQSVLNEVSVVAMGADPETAARIAATAAKSNANQKENGMTFNEWIVSLGLTPDTLTEEQLASLTLAYDAIMAGSHPVEGSGEDPAVEASADMPEEEEAAAKASARRPAVRAASRPTVPFRPMGGGVQANTPARSDVVFASLAQSCGIRPATIAAQLLPATRENVMHEASRAENRSMGLHELMDGTIRAAGKSYHGSRRNSGFIRAAMEANATLQNRRSDVEAAFTTYSLPGILGNLANTALLDSYTAFNATWPQFCRARSHANFQIHTHYRLDSTGAFTKVAKDGELKHAGVTEAAYTNQLDTYGTMISLTRQDIINDHLGAFNEIANQLGRMAALRQEELVYTVLLSNPGNFFHANNNNYFEGSGTNLGIDSLTTGVQKFLDMVDSNGKPVMETPRILLVPTGVKTLADQLNNDATIIAGTSTAKQTAENPHRGMYTVVSSPYLNNTAIRNDQNKALTGQSATAWYLFADPASRAAIALATLNGQTQPTIESNDAEFDILGIRFRAFSDFGVGMEDPTAAVKSKGAA